jgi:hypothetical protein
MYVYPDDKASGHVYSAPLPKVKDFGWTPFVIVLALAIVVYIGLVVTGILPAPFAF